MLLKPAEHFQQRPNLLLPQKGIVVDNRDPRGLGRVKAVVGGILEGTRQELPWITPWTPVGQGGSTGKASNIVPDIADMIAVEFKFGDIYSGFYTGHWNSKASAPSVFNEDYPNTQGTSDQAGNKKIVNKLKKTTEYIFASGAKIRVDANGDMTFVTKGKVRFESEDGETFSEYDMQTGNTCNKGGENTLLEGRQVKIDAQESNISTGNLTEQISGARLTQVDGSLINQVGGAFQNVIAGNSSNVVTGTSEDLFSQKATRTYGLGYEESVVLGDIVQSILAGNIDITLTLGSEKRQLLAGDYQVNIVAGNIVLQTLAGSVTIGAGAASLAIDATGNVVVTGTTYNLTSAGAVNLTAGATMGINAPLVQFNGGVGQVLTNLTSPVVDTVTGAPSIGNPTILA